MIACCLEGGCRTICIVVDYKQTDVVSFLEGVVDDPCINRGADMDWQLLALLTS